MIREFGTLGFFIKFNQSASTQIKIVDIFSSSAASTRLFSASTNSSNNIIFSQSSSCFVNGSISQTVKDNQWQHISFTFNPKITTTSSNNFLVRFGQSSSVDFQIQNIYMLDTLLSPLQVSYVHNAFTGGASAIIKTGESSVPSILLIDRNEKNHSSSVTGKIYMPYPSQTKFYGDISSVHDDETVAAFTSSKMSNDDTYIDGYKLTNGDLFISLVDNKMYTFNVTGNNSLSEVSIPNGQYVVVSDGITYSNTCWLKTTSGFTELPLLEKIDYFLEEN